MARWPGRGGAPKGGGTVRWKSPRGSCGGIGAGYGIGYAGKWRPWRACSAIIAASAAARSSVGRWWCASAGEYGAAVGWPRGEDGCCCVVDVVGFSPTSSSFFEEAATRVVVVGSLSAASGSGVVSGSLDAALSSSSSQSMAAAVRSSRREASESPRGRPSVSAEKERPSRSASRARSADSSRNRARFALLLRARYANSQGSSTSSSSDWSLSCGTSGWSFVVAGGSRPYATQRHSTRHRAPDHLLLSSSTAWLPSSSSSEEDDDAASLKSSFALPSSSFSPLRTWRSFFSMCCFFAMSSPSRASSGCGWRIGGRFRGGTRGGGTCCRWRGPVRSL
mmetsp:Transcript_12933/g.39052  ORF Transcript_12933/g.39052 Transcript_12933/m.39052 type:complete len:336 (-) Transcript_12933:663-1670(-)